MYNGICLEKKCSLRSCVCLYVRVCVCVRACARTCVDGRVYVCFFILYSFKCIYREADHSNVVSFFFFSDMTVPVSIILYSYLSLTTLFSVYPASLFFIVFLSLFNLSIFN